MYGMKGFCQVSDWGELNGNFFLFEEIDMRKYPLLAAQPS